MRIYSWAEHYKLYHWNMLDLLEVIEPNTISSIVTDPPYELNFMWKWWDNSWIAFQKETREKCLEVLKPWWYLLAFWGSRTYHRIACAIEDAGFEIRDCIMWLYGSGFPKSMNIWLAIDKKNWIESEVIWEWKSGWTSRAYQSEEQTTAGEYQIKKASNKWNWWGTALKPSYEPIIVARKPLEWSCTDNVIKYWVGGINIDECRVGTDEKTYTIKENWFWDNFMDDNRKPSWKEYEKTVIGRFPANTILTYWDDDKEEVCWWFPNTKSKGSDANFEKTNQDNPTHLYTNIKSGRHFEDSGSAARYFYCAKASKRDRDEGMDVGRNEHPTVKPTDLMQYRVRLVTPNGWIVLDPFNWSGSTGKAVMYENKDRNKNYKYIWIELTDEYLPIAKARIEYAINVVEEKQEEKQPTLFGLSENDG
jgi:site-specific DNA-methyltransferase (adenine-specific)